MNSEAYVRARTGEGRLLRDDQVALLPGFAGARDHTREWHVRRRSSEQLVERLASYRRPLTIVDAGCGNGWMSNQVALVPQSTVIGVDINTVELQQAQRVFGARRNVTFVEDDALHCDLGRVDIIVAASLLQYVADVPGALRRWVGMLRAGGEIHVLDTHFYHARDVAAARRRTLAHYRQVGVPEMVAAYHHHRWDVLDGLRHEVVRPARKASVWSRLGRSVVHPFPWIVIPRQEVQR
jgi:SAM-dependent methyltransferase